MSVQVVKMADFESQHAAIYGESYTPVSLSGRSSPAMHQRLGTVSFPASTFPGLPLDMTPPGSATTPYFATMGMTSTDSPMSMTAAVDGLNFGMASSSFGSSLPATPERNASFSSMSSSSMGGSSAHHDFGTPLSPVGHMMPPSYSLGSVSSSVSSLAGPPTPDATAYAFPDVHQQHHQQLQQQQHHHQRHHSASKSGLAQQQPLPSPYAPGGGSSSSRYAYLSPYGQASTNDCSPSEFYWHAQGQQARPDSPAINYFGDRQPMPLPPPPAAVTLKSSVVKNEDGSSSHSHHSHHSRSSLSPIAHNSHYDAPRSLCYSSAQMSAKALQDAVSTQSKTQAQSLYGGYASGCDGSNSNNSSSSGSIMVRRNGMQVAKIASGAYKCTVPDCTSRPFKRSEHLKRHITTHHDNKDQYTCKFCERQFNRKDNWRSHLKLHTAPRGKNARTDYFPEAVTLYTEEMRKVTKSRARKALGLQ